MPLRIGVGGGALQPHVERGVDAEGVALKSVVLEFALQRVVHQVHEVRRFQGLRAAPLGTTIGASIASA